MPDTFAMDTFLARPLTARVATNGPTVRPTWYPWETGPSGSPPARGRSCWTGRGPAGGRRVRPGQWPGPAGGGQGSGEILTFDVPRGRRKLARYLGAHESRWDPRFRRYPHDGARGVVWLRMRPTSLVARDLSYAV